MRSRPGRTGKSRSDLDNKRDGERLQILGSSTSRGHALRADGHQGNQPRRRPGRDRVSPSADSLHELRLTLGDRSIVRQEAGWSTAASATLTRSSSLTGPASSSSSCRTGPLGDCRIHRGHHGRRRPAGASRPSSADHSRRNAHAPGLWSSRLTPITTLSMPAD